MHITTTTIVVDRYRDRVEHSPMRLAKSPISGPCQMSEPTERSLIHRITIWWLTARRHHHGTKKKGDS